VRFLRYEANCDGDCQVLKSEPKRVWLIARREAIGSFEKRNPMAGLGSEREIFDLKPLWPGAQSGLTNQPRSLTLPARFQICREFERRPGGRPNTKVCNIKFSTSLAPWAIPADENKKVAPTLSWATSGEERAFLRNEPNPPDSGMGQLGCDSDCQRAVGQRFEHLAAKRDWRVPQKYFRGKDLGRVTPVGRMGAIRVKRKTPRDTTAAKLV
jgi:hypothetical protein